MARGGTLLALPALALLAAGCGGGKGTVTGEVTYDGKPIPWGRITFLGQEGKKVPRSAWIINGQYTIKDCPTGPVKISVEPLEARAAPKDVGKMAEMAKEHGHVDPPPEVIGKKLDIPRDVIERYGNPETSGLEYTVESGDNTNNIELKKK